MKKFKIVYRHTDIDTSPSSQVRLDRIIAAARNFKNRGIGNLELSTMGARVFYRDDDALVVMTSNAQYICKLEGQGEILYSDLNGSNPQKLDKYDAHYEHVKILEETILLATKP